jgi:putative transposase
LSGLDKAVQIIINQAMLIERDRHLRADRYERTPRDLNPNNFELSVPQNRDGQFCPSFPERGLRSEPSLKISLAEMYIQGISTRKVNAIIITLWC